MKLGKAPGLDGFPVECKNKTDRMVAEPVESKSSYGISTYGLAWCMYSAPRV